MRPPALLLSALLCLLSAGASAAPRHHLHFRQEADDGRPGPTAAELQRVLEGLQHSEEAVCQLAVDALLAGLVWDSWPFEAPSLHALKTALQCPVRRPDAVALLTRHLDAGAFCVRRLAATLLGRSDSPEALAGLRAALAAPNANERQAAVLGLGERADAATVGLLLPALADTDAEVAATAAWALGETGDARALPALLQATHHTEARVRQAAVAGLGQLQDGLSPSVQQALRAALADASPEVRREAAQALGR